MIPFYKVIADLEILTKDTLKVAVGKKNIAYPFITADRRFFSMMDNNGRDREGSISFAITRFLRKTVCMAIAWTKTAVFKLFEGWINFRKIQDGMILFSLFLTDLLIHTTLLRGCLISWKVNVSR